MGRLRSDEWYAGDDRNGYLHRAWMRRGVPSSGFEGRAQIAIANTASDLTPCNAHLNEVADAVKQGVYEAGGIPLNLPVVSLGETNVRPTAMLWRNMAAMAMEEMFRANPIDGLVLLGGCDKTIPALLMAAASVDLPAVVVPGGPMLNGHFRGTPLGCGTDVWKLSEEVRAGRLSQDTFVRSESSMIRSRVLTRGSFLNAIVALAAVGGSTNAVVHLLAIAGRLGVELTLDDFDRVGADVPLLVNLQPAGRDLI